MPVLYTTFQNIQQKDVILDGLETCQGRPLCSYQYISVRPSTSWVSKATYQLIDYQYLILLCFENGEKLTGTFAGVDLCLLQKWGPGCPWSPENLNLSSVLRWLVQKISVLSWLLVQKNAKQCNKSWSWLSVITCNTLSSILSWLVVKKSSQTKRDTQQNNNGCWSERWWKAHREKENAKQWKKSWAIN